MANSKDRKRGRVMSTLDRVIEKLGDLDKLRASLEKRLAATPKLRTGDDDAQP